MSCKIQGYFSKWHRQVAWVLLLVGILGLVACAVQSRTAKKMAQDSSAAQDFQNSLTFNDVTLEQSDEHGQPFWKVKAKQAIYRKDKKVAEVQQPDGELFEDGQVVYKIKAAQGEIQQDGKQLFLKGQIVAIDPRNQVVLHGNELEWRPQEDLLLVRSQLTGTHKQLTFVAQEARANSRSQRIELLGQVVANTTSDPILQMRTEHLIWQIREQKLTSDRPVAFDHYKAKVVTDRATSNQGEMNLNTKVVTLEQNAQVVSTDPSVQVTSNNLSWDLNTEIVTANQPVQIVHRQEKVTATAQQGRVNLQKKIAYLNGNVYSVAQRGQSLKSNELTWYIPTQLVEAQGAVVYQQRQPPLNVTGNKGVGNLQNQTVTVSGGRVVTVIVP